MKKEWLYIPNLIGYVRLLFLAFFFIAVDPLVKVLCMSANLVLDIFDGKMARFFNQCSLFGARFDLIIDMLSLTLLSFYVAFLSNSFWLTIFFISCGINDLINYSMSINIFYGKNVERKINHKTEIRRKGTLLPLYYSGMGLALANILHDAYLLSKIYSPAFIQTFFVYIFLFGFLFRQCCLIEQAFYLFRFCRTNSLYNRR